MALWQPRSLTMDRCTPFSCLFIRPGTLGESHVTEVIKPHPKISLLLNKLCSLLCICIDVEYGDCLVWIPYSFPYVRAAQRLGLSTSHVASHKQPEQAAVLWPPSLSCIWSLGKNEGLFLGSPQRRRSIHLQLPPSAGAPLIIVMDGEGKGKSDGPCLLITYP